jgi:hypothetical protein
MDSKGENNNAVGVDLRSTEDTFRVKAADVFEGSKSSDSSDSSEGSCQTGSNDSSLSSDDTTIKSDSTLGSIIKEAIGSLAGGRWIFNVYTKRGQFLARTAYTWGCRNNNMLAN